jgi:hypothetical protein
MYLIDEPTPPRFHPNSSMLARDKNKLPFTATDLEWSLHGEENPLSPPTPPFATVAPGGGPRHFTFGRTGKFGYQLAEMSGALNVFSCDASACSLKRSAPTDDSSTSPTAASVPRHSRTGQYRRLGNRPGERHFDPGRGAPHHHHATQLYRRSHGLLSPFCRRTEQHRRYLQDRSGYRQAPPQASTSRSTLRSA